MAYAVGKRLAFGSGFNRFGAIAIGTACLALPASAQNLFVVSRASQQVLEYDAADGAPLGAFAETVTEGFRFPADIALRPSDGVLYVSSASTGEIWSYTTASGEPITPAVATGLFAPFGIDFDAAGTHLYFADASDPESETTDAILELEIASGVASTVGTNNQADFLGVAVNGSDVFATDVAQHRILRFPVSGGAGSTVISTGLSAPGALLFVTPTQMLVADTGNDRVVEYLESGGSWSFHREVLGAGAGVDEPCGLAIAPDGRLSVSARSSGDVVLVDLTSLAIEPLVAPGSGGLQDPKSLAWSGSTLLVASVSGNAVFYYDDAGQPTGARADGLSASLDAGLEIAPDGSRLYVASINGNDVLEYDLSSGALRGSFNSVCPGFPPPFFLSLGPSGDELYIGCLLTNDVVRFDVDTRTVIGTFVLGGSGGLLAPRGLAFGPNGNLFVASASGEILEYDGTTGAYQGPPAFVDSGGNGGGAIDPYGLRFHQGTLYVASFGHDEVMAFDATSGAFLSTFVGSGSGGLTGPTGLDFGPDGDLYVTSLNDDAIRRYAGGTGAFVESFVPGGSGGLDEPFDLAFRPAPVQLPALPATGGALLALALAAAAARRIRSKAWEVRA